MSLCVLSPTLETIGQTRSPELVPLSSYSKTGWKLPMRRMRICEEQGTGIDKVVSAVDSRCDSSWTMGGRRFGVPFSFRASIGPIDRPCLKTQTTNSHNSPECVTYVSGTICYLCVRSGHVRFWRPQGDSNPRYRRERAMSWASGRWGLAGGRCGYPFTLPFPPRPGQPSAAFQNSANSIYRSAFHTASPTFGNIRATTPGVVGRKPAKLNKGV